MREFQESTVSEPVPAAFLERIVAESLKLPARVWQAWLREMTEAEVPSAAGTIGAPTLVLWGDRDAYCPRASQDALVAAIPGAQLVAYEGVGHCPRGGHLGESLPERLVAPAQGEDEERAGSSIAATSRSTSFWSSIQRLTSTARGRSAPGRGSG